MSSLSRALDACPHAHPQSNAHLSFAPARPGCRAQWYSSGCAYFNAVADAMEAARSEILLAGWFLSPEVYLKRPAIDENRRWRLDEVLKRKAQQGVRVRVLVYKELTVSLPNDSAHALAVLSALHPGILVQRSPEHNPVTGLGAPRLTAHASLHWLVPSARRSLSLICSVGRIPRRGGLRFRV